MPSAAHRSRAPSAARTELTAISISLELSQSKGLITSLTPKSGGKMSRFIVAASDIAGLLARFAKLQRKADARARKRFGIVLIQEAGLDGFWLHREGCHTSLSRRPFASRFVVRAKVMQRARPRFVDRLPIWRDEMAQKGAGGNPGAVTKKGGDGATGSTGTGRGGGKKGNSGKKG